MKGLLHRHVRRFIKRIALLRNSNASIHIKKKTFWMQPLYIISAMFVFPLADAALRDIIAWSHLLQGLFTVTKCQ